jgi:hypothetical protein
MAYPTVPAPYGFQARNLIGGQVFSGSTRNYVIQNGYTTSIFYGDFVTVTNGLVTRAAVTNSTSGKQTIGVFLGCSYTNPITKQKTFSQSYIQPIAAGDIQAIVCDDPDTVFKAVALTANGGTTLASGSQAIVGLNLAGSDLAGNINTGDSYNGLVIPTSTPSTGLPFRVLGLVPESATAQSVTGYSGSSGSFTAGTTITFQGTLAQAIPQGADIAYIGSNGQLVQTGAFVANSGGYAAGVTTVTADKSTSIPYSSTSPTVIVFTSYPELLVKINFGIHNYYAA